MRSKLVTRIAAGSAVVLMSLAWGAPGALAVPPEGQPTPNGGASSEHRNDSSAREQRDEHRASRAPGDTATASDVEAAALDQPQPASNADFSGHGANQHGAYDSTRDGSPSGNGNGNGAAIGKPCAGCVGKADNKNPPGQFPDGSDANNGYECDGNSGIGKTNPAHTGCVVAAPNPTVKSTAAVLGVSFTAPPPATAPAAVSPQTAAAPAVAALAATGAGPSLVPLACFGAMLVALGALPRWRSAGRSAYLPK